MACSVDKLCAIGVFGVGVLDADDFEEDEAFIAACACSVSGVVCVARCADRLTDAIGIFVETVGTVNTGHSVSCQVLTAEVGDDDLRGDEGDYNTQDDDLH